MKIHPASLFGSLILVAGLSVNAQESAFGQNPSCLSITAPAPKSYLTQPLCTIAIKTCPQVLSVTIAAQYTGKDGTTQDIASLGTLDKRPYVIIWNTDSIPEQLMTGMAIVAQADLPTGQTIAARSEGVFLVKPRAPVPACIIRQRDGLAMLRGDTVVISGKNESEKAIVSVQWNSAALTFDIRVVYPDLKSDLSAESLAGFGCEILVDPSSIALPYPSDSVIALDIPLSGKPSRRYYRPLFASDGSYRLTVQNKKQDLPITITPVPGKGWRLQCKMPLARTLKAGQIVRCNIVIKTPTAVPDGKYSWAGISNMDRYAPLHWTELKLEKSNFLIGSLFLWIASFLVALGFTVGIGGLIFLRRRRIRASSMRPPETIPEEHREILERIRVHIEQTLIVKNATLEGAAAALSLPERTVDRLCKRYYGWPFISCLMLSRVEVARERLRSSNAMEKSIAEQCGFESEAEMEKCFLKFYRTTPAKFRAEQQVT